ncbi:hypothetical protein D3C79_1121670 [compost metagenome]
MNGQLHGQLFGLIDLAVNRILHLLQHRMTRPLNLVFDNLLRLQIYDSAHNKRN